MNFFILIVLIILQSKSVTPETKSSNLTVSSPAFGNKEQIPVRYTCEGEDINPALVVGNIPPGTKSLALIADDPDASMGTFVHWVAWNIKPSEKIAENTNPGVLGKNGTGRSGYKGPCPPSGEHHYFFKVYALDVLLALPSGSDKKSVEQAMKGHVLAQGELVGLYKKSK